jgi:hypothetical protein
MIEEFGGGSALEFTSRMGCPNNQRKARVEVQLDRFGAETTWSLTSSGGKVYMKNSRKYGKNDYKVVEKCLLIVYDEAGKCLIRGNIMMYSPDQLCSCISHANLCLVIISLR